MIDPRLKLWLIYWGLYVSLTFVGRLYLLVNGEGLDPSFGEFATALAIGAVDDAAMGAVLGLPAICFLFFSPQRVKNRFLRGFAHAAAYVTPILYVLFEVSALIFWSEMRLRLNRLVFQYMAYPAEAFGFVFSLIFEVALGSAAVILVGAGLYYLLIDRVRAALDTELPKGALYRGRAIAFGLCLAYVPLLDAGPFRATQNRPVDEVTMNSFHSFMYSWRWDDLQWAGLFPEVDDDRGLAVLRASVEQDNTEFEHDDASRTLLRRVANEGPERRLNILLIVEESLDRESIHLRDDRGELVTPHFNQLVAEGLYFDQIRSTGSRTNQGLPALLTSFPTLPGAPIPHRPESLGMNSLPWVLRDYGYETAFFYAGMDRFDSMDVFLPSLGVDQILDQSDIRPDAFSTVWGVADEFLFDEALERLDARPDGSAPFFMTLLTVSNHYPYDIPEDRVEEREGDTPATLAMRYADQCLGHFIRAAREQSWFDDTLVVIVADHGKSLKGAATLPAESYRIPLLVLSPKHVEPGVVDAVGSSMDLAPTLLAMLGMSFDSYFFGVDLLRLAPGTGRAPIEQDGVLGWVGEEHAVILIPEHDPEGYRVIADTGALERVEAPDLETLELAVSTFQLAHRMLYSQNYHELGREWIAGRSNVEGSGFGAGQGETRFSRMAAPFPRRENYEPRVSSGPNHVSGEASPN